MSDAVQPLLVELGRRLRTARLGAGLSVAALAEEALVSRRYLTEAEAGRANPTVAVLVRLGQALGTSAGGLLEGLRPRRPERIALVGLRGAGKSTVGRRVAAALEVPFVALDRRIEERSGMRLGELFDLSGEEAFHRFEAEALEDVLARGNRMVIETGGSLVTREATFLRLRRTCRTVWLRASPDEHIRRVLSQGDRRPMKNRPRARDELRAILEARTPLYERCENTVDTTGIEPEDVARRVLAACGLPVTD